MKFNHELLDEKIKAAGDTHASLAQYLGMSKTNFSSIWNGRTGWQLKHIPKIAFRYSLSPQDVWDIFLADAIADLKSKEK